ncbi:MAG: DUF922 domain-containing protein [Sulfitobacter sp.]
MNAALKAALVVLVSGLCAVPALSAPQVTEKLKTYKVDATTVTGIRNQMRSRGPKGFWGYTTWQIRWSSGCQVTAKIQVTLPRHTNPSAMPQRVKRAFDAMVKNLHAHERLHAQHGIDAAYEIDRAGCRGAQKIIRKYNRADRALDKRTDHGKRDGVVFD